MSVITLGLSEVQVGQIATDGGEATTYEKIGKTYQNTCKMVQEKADVTEHYEEGQSAPEVRKKKKKVPILTFSIMDPDPTFLKAYMGGEVTGTGDEMEWSWSDTDEDIEASIRVIPEVGLVYTIPRADIEAVLNADMSSQGINLVDFTVTPLKPKKAGVKTIRARKKTATFPPKA
jgi:hypothetical protein|nr:MAG TPA: hypothetical protein [Bacteriophage sp.]